MFRHIITFLISLFICTVAQAQPSAVYSDCADIDGCVPNAITASSSDVLSNKSFSDNVGIGTPTPLQKVDIFGISPRVMFKDSDNTGNNRRWLIGAVDNGFANATNFFIQSSLDNGATMSPDFFMWPTYAIGIGTFDLDGRLTIMGRGTGNSRSLQIKNSAGSTYFDVYDNGNVGIGTTTEPRSRLDIGAGQLTAGSINLPSGEGYFTSTAGMYFDPDGSGPLLRLTQGRNIGIGTSAPSTTVELVKQGTNAPLMISSTATGDGDYIKILSNGNVGINTIEPTQKLETVGTIKATAFSGAGTSLTGTAASLTAGTATALAANGTNCSAGNYPLGVDASGNVEDCTLAGGGSVGIGTANTITFWPTTTTIGSLPTATYPNLTELSYVKDVTSSIQTQLNAKDAVTTAGDFITRTANDFDVDALDEDDMTSNSAVHLATQQSIKAYVDTAISGVSGGAGGWTDGGTNVYNTATTDTVGIGTTGASGSLEIVKQGSAIPLMVSATATGNGDYLIVNSAGNVGMGTVLPSAILDVVSANYPVAEFTRTSSATNSISGTMKIKGKSSSTVLDGYGVNFGAFIEGSGLAETQIGELAFIRDGADNSGAITFRPYSTGTGTERMRVSSGGNVGIGTSNPLALMAVGTTIPVASYTSVGSGDVYIQNDLEVDGTVYMGSCSGAGCSGASGWTDGGTAITTTTTTDTVGIGTTTVADGILQVGGDNVTIGIGGTNTTATGAGELYVKGDLEVDGTITGDGSGITNLGASAWSDGGTNVYVSPTTDNVGIGTTTPSTNFKADIRGNLYVSGNVGIGTLLPRGTLDLGPTGTVYAQTFTGPTGPTILGTSNNVGIGTITAGSLLTVGSTGQVTVSSAGAIATSSTVSVADDAYAAGWNASTAVPTKNAVYDKIETLGSGGWTDGSAAVYPTTSTDNVGIGTVSPGKKLDLYGTDSDIRMNSTDTAQFTGFQFYNGTTQVGEFGAGGSTTSTPNQIFLEHVVPNAPIDFMNDTGIQLRIKGPNVGIGTTGSGGAIFVSPDGSCSKCGPNNADVWACASVTCL